MYRKWIITTLFFLFGVVCFVTGGYFGSIWGSGISESIILADNHKRQKEIYACGIVGNIQCFSEKYRELAEFNVIHSSMLIRQDVSGMFSADLEDVRSWNLRVLNEE